MNFCTLFTALFCCRMNYRLKPTNLFAHHIWRIMCFFAYLPLFDLASSCISGTRCLCKIKTSGRHTQCVIHHSQRWTASRKHLVKRGLTDYRKCPFSTVDRRLQDSAIYLLKFEASVRLCAPWSQKALTLYPATDCAAATDISGVSGCCS